MMSDTSWMADWAAQFDAKPEAERNQIIEQALREQINQEFGWAAAFLDHPELGPLLRQAAQGGWTMQKLQTEIRKTQWWQKTDESQRNWDVLQGQDPASAERQIEGRVAEINNAVATLGSSMAPDRVRVLAQQSLRNGWTPQDLSNAVGSELVRAGKTTDLRRGLIGQGVQSAAREFGVPLSRQAVDGWVKQIAEGKATQDDYLTYVRNQARSLFPTLTEDLDRGLTVEQVADPYRQVASRVLQINPTDVDFSKSQWNRALNFAGEQGGRRMMTLDEWENVLRQDDQYGYTQTDEAKEKAYSVARSIAAAFGRTT
jgi:hypothetical protein